MNRGLPSVSENDRNGTSFPGFIVLVGCISSGTLFEPRYGFLVQNKDDVSIPQLLHQIPTDIMSFDGSDSASASERQEAVRGYGQSHSGHAGGYNYFYIKIGWPVCSRLDT